MVDGFRMRFRPRRRSTARGFTLLEVMVALLIAAVALTAASSLSSSIVVNSTASSRRVQAALVLTGAVLDIEEEYKIEGFPTNDETNGDCDVPRPYDRMFDCEYTLEGLEFDAGTLSEIATQSLTQLFGGGAGGGEGEDGGGIANIDINNLDPQDLAGRLSGSGAGMLPGISMLAQDMMTTGGMLSQVCGVNLQAALQNAFTSVSFFPLIVEKAAEVTRKLTVTLSWKEGPRDRRELKIETFIIAIPEEEEELMKALGTAGDAGLIPDGGAGAPGGGLPGGGAAPGGGRGR